MVGVDPFPLECRKDRTRSVGPRVARSGLVCLLVTSLVVPTQGGIPSDLRGIFEVHLDPYAELRRGEFEALCARYGLDESIDSNARRFYELRFLHDLFTGSSARDGARGGILQIPYLWHWVEPNPRHEIRSTVTGDLLVERPPPRGFARYRSHADIDRVPSQYLADLVTASPRYSHPDFGDFYTFGWCSEREMAFAAVVDALGYVAKIKQSGIHTWSEVWCQMATSDGTRSLILRVDNTFDAILWSESPDGDDVDAWRRDIGSGTQISWYNRMALDEQERDKIDAETIGAASRARIDSLVHVFIHRSSH